MYTFFQPLPHPPAHFVRAEEVVQLKIEENNVKIYYSFIFFQFTYFLYNCQLFLLTKGGHGRNVVTGAVWWAPFNYYLVFYLEFLECYKKDKKGK